ncbi:MAG TPA: hypothetical protein DIU06_03575, partial [Rhodospirillaceae bacterium]|nr:hypothetical protein [Rhodospirillaceae bacterium]
GLLHLMKMYLLNFAKTCLFLLGFAAFCIVCLCGVYLTYIFGVGQEKNTLGADDWRGRLWCERKCFTLRGESR